MLKNAIESADFILIHVHARPTQSVLLQGGLGCRNVFGGASTMAVSQHIYPPVDQYRLPTG
jgi:hypothetical protein